MGLLRFLLAISVVLEHSSSIFGFTFVGGQIAVQAFYIISGFYMALILNEKYTGVNSSYKLFITNRFLRLYPVYWTVLLLTILYSLGIYIHSHGKAFAGFENYVTYFHQMSLSSFCFLIFTNLFLFFQDIVMFLGLNTVDGNLFLTSNFKETQPMLYTFLLIPQAWTIGVELTFYLIAPFLARKKMGLIALLIFASLLLRFIIYHSGFNHDPWTYRFFPTELLFFMLGIVSYNIYKKIRTQNIKASYLKIIFGFILTFTLFFSFLPLPEKYAVYLFMFFICLPFVFLLAKKWKTDAYIGELSYPIYISHIFVLTLLGAFKIPVIGGLGLTLTIPTVLFSILLNEFIAKKIEKIRQRRLLPAAKSN